MEQVKVIIDDYPYDIDGYTVRSVDDNGEPFYIICINSHLNDEAQRQAYYHEMLHIQSDDFQAEELVGTIERERRKENKLKYKFRI